MSSSKTATLILVHDLKNLEPIYINSLNELMEKKELLETLFPTDITMIVRCCNYYFNHDYIPGTDSKIIIEGIDYNDKECLDNSCIKELFKEYSITINAINQTKEYQYAVRDFVDKDTSYPRNLEEQSKYLFVLEVLSTQQEL